MKLASLAASLLLAAAGRALGLSLEARDARADMGLPFSTSGRDILDKAGNKVLYAGTNWPGHLEIMIPEGLQYQSIETIVQKIAGFGLNSVRITYAIQMVDEIYDKGRDTSLQETVINALGQQNGTRILEQILKNNPQFTSNTTRLQVFDAVSQELAKQGVIMHLDNHVSRAGWCCVPGDGNGWFGEGSFSVANWTRGWEYMAKHAATNWPSLASFGLRNELRPPLLTKAEPYDWYTWFVNMNATASAIHAANPDVVLFFGGLESDTSIGIIPRGGTLHGSLTGSDAGKTAYFRPDDLPYKGKIVLEVHKYDLFNYKGPCWLFEFDLKYNGGFQGLDASERTTKYVFPMVLSEFGFAQDQSAYKTVYAQCLTSYIQQEQFGFMQWDVSGSYYLRQGTQDYDEGFALLTHDWSATRSPEAVEATISKMVAATKNYTARAS